VVRLFSLWLLAAGCDYAFHIEHVEDPIADAASVCVEIGHDEDGDGLDDACDPCPFDRNNDGDADNDGIAFACDPDPTAPNKVLLFAGFGTLDPAMTQIGGGIVNDTWVPSPTNTSAMLWQGMADPIWVVAGVDVTGLTVASYRELGFVFDATPGQQAVDGTYCVLGRASDDYLQVFVRDRPNNDSDLLTQSPTTPLTELRSGLVRGRHGRTVGPGSSCSFTNGMGVQTGIYALRTPPPVQGGVAIVSTQVEATFTFLFVVGPA
jgi:hypothetical protein